jgi:hypothetical protein
MLLHNKMQLQLGQDNSTIGPERLLASAEFEKACGFPPLLHLGSCQLSLVIF